MSAENPQVFGGALLEPLRISGAFLSVSPRALEVDLHGWKTLLSRRLGVSFPIEQRQRRVTVYRNRLTLGLHTAVAVVDGDRAALVHLRPQVYRRFLEAAKAAGFQVQEDQ